MHLERVRGEYVFTTADGAFHRRSNVSRRAMRPAADGVTRHPRISGPVAPVVPGLTFHGFRHSHKTWMIADQIPEIAQSERLGHRLADKIQQAYSHVAPEVEARLLTALQDRWVAALAELAAPDWATAVTTVRGLPTGLSDRQLAS